MGFSTAWLQVWKILNDNPEAVTAMDIVRLSLLSHSTILNALQQLSQLDMINMVRDGRTKQIVRCQRFYALSEDFGRLYIVSKVKR